MPAEPTLLLLPGLGADPRACEPQRALSAHVELLAWPEPLSGDETLAHYAQRIAASIGPRPNLFVGGISLGAMVALEAARLLDARGIFLIGGCVSHRQISPLFRAVLGASAMLPLPLVRPALLFSPLALKVFERLKPDDRARMTRMLRENSPAQTRWSCRAILRWECCETDPGAPIFAIHGEDDEVIPLENVQVDRALPGGHHLINLQCADEVNAFITERIRSVMETGRD